MHIHRSRPRHHAWVIDQDGNVLEDTVRFPRLAFVLGLGQRDDEPETAPLLPALPAVAGPTRTLPVAGHGTIAMRIPEAPKAPEPRWPRSLFDDPEFVTTLTLIKMRAHHDGYELMRVFDRRARVLADRVAALAARVRAWTIESCDLDLAAAYAEGGTERLLKLTPQVLARLDAQALAGRAVAA